jgi:hypothetical protein
MNPRSQLLAILTLFSIALAAGATDNCTLNGVTVDRDGTPIGGIAVNATGYGMFRVKGQEGVTSGPDGTFSMSNLNCGTYMLEAHQPGHYESSAVLMVNVKKAPKIRVVLPYVDRLAASMSAAPETTVTSAASAGGVPAPATPAEPTAIDRLRRSYFERLRGSQIGVFDSAPLAQQKSMYMMAFAGYMAGIMEGDSAPSTAADDTAKAPKRPWRQIMGFGGVPAQATSQIPAHIPNREEDSRAKRQLANAAAIVQQTLPGEDVSIFGRGPEIDQARLFLSAVSKLPQQHPLCSMFSLYLADTVEATHNLAEAALLARLLGDSTPDYWLDKDTASRCKALDAAVPKFLDLARALERDGSLDNVKSISQRIDINANPERTVLENFGNAGRDKYGKVRSQDEQLELYRAGLMMQMCWYVAFMAL